MSQVFYRPIEGFPGYCVGSDGSVWSRRSRNGRGGLVAQWRLMSPARDGNGYQFVGLCHGRRGASLRKVHRLVLEAFVGPRPAGQQCRHLDGNPANNRLSNLCWGTPADNAADQVVHGTSPVGRKNPAAVLDEDKVRQIRRLLAEGTARSSAARLFGVSKSTINDIVRGRHWTHVV